jgi:hypothetical protein
MVFDQIQIVDLIPRKLGPHQRPRVLPRFAPRGEHPVTEQRSPTVRAVLAHVPVHRLCRQHSLYVCRVPRYDEPVVRNRHFAGVHVLAHLGVDRLDDILRPGISFGGEHGFNETPEAEEALGGHLGDGAASELRGGAGDALALAEGEEVGEVEFEGKDCDEGEDEEVDEGGHFVVGRASMKMDGWSGMEYPSVGYEMVQVGRSRRFCVVADGYFTQHFGLRAGMCFGIEVLVVE